MLHTNRWSPDTCGCVLEYTFDDEAPSDKRIHTPSKIVKQCNAHSHLNKVKEHHDEVLKENQTKNIVHNHLLDNMKDLKDWTGHEISFYHSGKKEKRQLHFNITNISDDQRTALQKLADEKAGKDKVVIH